MKIAEKNYLLLREIEANRRFLLMAYRQNPKLLESAEERIKQLFEVAASGEPGGSSAGMRKQRGISLIELIMFIVIIGIGVAGILLVMNQVTGHSADTLQRKQALAIAESLLEEVELMPSTFCDPDDANASTATSAVVGAGGCAVTLEGMGPEAGETRYVVPQFDNVNDYNGFTMPAGGGIRDIINNPIAGLNGYAATIVVAQAALGAVPAAESLRITVTVTAPGGEQVVLDGYRTRSAPRI